MANRPVNKGRRGGIPRISLPARASGRPKYRAVVEAIEDALRHGQIAVGERLPAERTLASLLRVSRTTTTAAYKELEARGLVRGHVGRGTMVVGTRSDSGAIVPWAQRVTSFVTQAAQIVALPHSSRGERISFAHGWPDPALYPEQALASIVDGLVARAPGAVFLPSPVQGERVLREALAAWLGSQGIRAVPDEIVITSGAQEGLNAIARALVAPGDKVLTESPTYVGAILAFRGAGAEVVGVPLDQDGIDCDLLEEALIRHRPKLIYLMPNFQHPTGVVLTRDRRQRVLELAGRFRVPILESDLYGQIFFEGTPPPSLKALDEARLVIHQGSFSKMVVPGLRVGWLVAPPPAVPAILSAQLSTTLCASNLSQRIVAEFLERGHLDRHLETMRRGCRVRRDRLVAALRDEAPTLRVRIPSGGYYAWVELPRSLTTTLVVPAAMELGVEVRPGTQFFPEGGGKDRIRIAFAAVGPRSVAEGIRVLGEVVRSLAKRKDSLDAPSPTPFSAV